MPGVSPTSGGPGAEWLRANQQHLTGALAELRAALERHLARQSAGGAGPDTERFTTEGSFGAGPEVGGAPMALDRLTSLFGLSAFERNLLLLTAGPELDASFAALCAALQGDPQRSFPTFSLALAALLGAHWSALSPGAPLRRWRMVEVGAGSALTTSPLRIDERVLHYLTGVAAPEPRLAGIVAPLTWSGELAGTHAEMVQRVLAVWRRTAGWPNPPVIQLRGDGASVKRAIAAAACESAGLKLSVTAVEAIPTAPHETESMARLWEREAALSGSALLVECGEFDFADGPRTAALARLLERIHGIVLVSLREPRRLGHRPAVGLDVHHLSAAEQRGVWRAALGEAGERLNGQVELMVSQFNLTADTIQAAVTEARGTLGAGAAEPELARALWDSCRQQSRPRLEDLAQRIQSAVNWEDLVLPEAQRQILRDIAAHVRQRATVYETWGFGRHGARGLGISALFSGASGTGKTMAAEVLGNELRLDVYRIDLSAVVSKYIGETEKNLRRIFDAAEEGGAILLFDEADALFGKRSEVKDSHDRYANIEVSYLLQRMECYKGLAILTTNMRSALDTAFLRRLRFVVQFPFPDAIQRAEIWRRVFPASTPVDGVDPWRLAGLNLAGGNIRNIAMNAAFLAADLGEPVRMTHLLRAARSEYAKLEKPLTEAEIEGWG